MQLREVEPGYFVKCVRVCVGGAVACSFPSSGHVDGWFWLAPYARTGLVHTALSRPLLPQ